MYLSYIYLYYSPMVPKHQSSQSSVKSISLQFNTDPMSQFGNFSYKLRMLPIPMLALPVSEIGKIFGNPLGFTLQPNVKIVPIDPYFSLDILKI